MILCFFILFLFVTTASAADFLWPLQQNFGVSASFGESRGDHYHAGIDLSTNGETGLPVLAIADGSVYRLKIQKRAYGKALYIQHANGTQSVYAHLDGYSRELGLQSLYESKAARMGTPYVGDIFLDRPIRVKRGQVVAFSGESGAGLPHLHLEIRKNETVIINPLLNGLQNANDSIPPTFQAVYFYPLTHESAINGELETTELRLKKRETTYRPEATTVVRGDFAISVSVYDSGRRPYHRAPYKMIYSIDDQEIYSVAMDQFSYTQPEGFGLFYDLGKPGPAFYEYPIFLREMADFRIPFVKRSVPFSTSALATGKHLLRIEAIDANNNRSIAEIPIVVNHPPTFEFVSLRNESGSLVIRSVIQDRDGIQNGTLAAEVEYSSDAGKTYRKVASTSLEAPATGDSLKFAYSIPTSEFRNARSLVVRARGHDGIEHSPYLIAKINTTSMTLMEHDRLPSGTLRYEAHGPAIRVIFDAEELLTQKLSLTAGDPPVSFPLRLITPTSSTSIVPAPKINGNYTLALPGGQSLTVPVNFVRAGEAKVVSTEFTELSLQENSLYKDAWIWTKLMPMYSSRSLPPVAPILQLGPRGFPLKRATKLTFAYPDHWKDPEKLSIYRWNRVSQTWSSLDSKVDTKSRTVETNITYLDLYALIYDNVAPRISSIFPKRRSSTRNPSPVLAVQVRDAGMDVDDEKITFYVDGVPYEAEYDPDRNVATAKITRVLRKGSHKFFAVAYDYAGNKTQTTPVTFRVL